MKIDYEKKELKDEGGGLGQDDHGKWRCAMTMVAVVKKIKRNYSLLQGDTWAYCYFDEGEKGGGERRGLAQRDQSQLQRHCHAQLMP